MYKVTDFIKWALTHVRASTIPSGAVLPLPLAECGTEPWEYLFGSVRVMTTQATLDHYWENHYKKQKGMTRAKYDALTRDWDRNGYATDCQGLLDAYLTYECDEFTDKNANWVYDNWCTERGRIDELTRPYVVGEALFMSNGSRMTHIGWVCGFAVDGVPLVVEARGIAYGVVVTRLDGRNWTHRGLMTQKFDYNEVPIMIRFEVTTPMQRGEPYEAMQNALDLAGYTDTDGERLEIDGKWGRKSQQAFDAMIADYAAEVVPVPDPEPVITVEPLAVWKSEDGMYELCIKPTVKEAPAE